MKIAYLMVLVVGVTGVSATGCKKIASLATNKAASAATEALGGGDAANASIGNYNKGFNLLIDDPQKMIEEYFSKIPKDGPEQGKKYTLFPRHNFAQTKIADIKKAFDEGEKAAPDDLKHLAPLAKVCTEDIEKVLETFKAAHLYYDAEDYKDDKGAKGKELHAAFVKAAETFEQNLQKFENALTVIEEKQMTEELKKYEADKSYGYWFRIYNQKANQLIKTKKKDTYLAAFAELEQAHTGLTAFATGKSDLNTAYKSYVNQADRYLASAKKLKRSFEEAVPKEEDLERGHEALINDYNNMISISNSLRELEANNLLK
jgi:hypothetical protein